VGVRYIFKVIRHFPLAVGKFPNKVSGLMQWARHTVETRYKEVGLSVNPDKTEFVVFTRSKLPGV